MTLKRGDKYLKNNNSQDGFASTVFLKGLIITRRLYINSKYMIDNHNAA